MSPSAADLEANRSELTIFASSLVVYLVLGLIGQNLVFEGTTVSPLWPAAGVALGLAWRVHLRGLVSARSVALSVALGQFVVFWLGPSFKALLAHGVMRAPHSNALYALLPAAGSSLGLIAAIAVLRLRGFGERLLRPHDVLSLVLATLVQGAIAAPLGALALTLMGTITPSITLDAAITWARGDWLGGVLLAPVFLTPSERVERASNRVEPALVILCTAVTTSAVFLGRWSSDPDEQSATYLCLLPVLWGATRLSGSVVVAQGLIVAAVATLPTLRGIGPFSDFATLNTRMRSLQAFLAVGSITSLAIFTLEHQRREAEAELVDARRRAEAGSRAKSVFLANMSHEIRTPLGGVLGAAQLLSKSALDTDQSELVEVIRGSGEGLLALLNDVLDFSKIEAGKFDLVDVAFEPRRLVKEVTDLFRVRLAEGVTLTVEDDASLPRWLLGDSARLRQIVSNLVGNAVKFTPSGGRITVRQRSVEGRYVIEVADTGIGIPKERQHALFEVFVQVDASTARRYGGTGLGLALCRKLTELMGGHITLESAEGEGTRLTVDLPMREAALDATPRPQASSTPLEITAGLRVLVVEDNAVNRLIIERILRSARAVIGNANTGREAVEACERASWDVVLMDCQMPEMDGLEATRLIRAREAARCEERVPIVALTANATEEDRRDCIDAGMDLFLAKPVRLNAVLDVLASAARRRTVQPTPGA